MGNRWKGRCDRDIHALPAGCETLGRGREKTDRTGEIRVRTLSLLRTDVLCSQHRGAIQPRYATSARLLSTRMGTPHNVRTALSLEKGVEPNTLRDKFCCCRAEVSRRFKAGIGIMVVATRLLLISRRLVQISHSVLPRRVRNAAGCEASLPPSGNTCAAARRTSPS